MTKIVLLDKEEFSHSDLQCKPLGGAQTAFIELVYALARQGCMVIVRNHTSVDFVKGYIDWRNLGNSEVPDGDLYIVNRAVELLALVPANKRRVLWLHNHAKYLLRPLTLWKLIKYRPLLIFSGKYHQSTFIFRHFFRSRIIPLGISSVFLRSSNSVAIPAPKVIFSSNPLRSLRWLVDRWLAVRKSVPAGELHIFAGHVVYGSWGVSVRSAMQDVLDYARRYSEHGIVLREPIGKDELALELSTCRAMFYRGDLAETFCLAVAEAQAMAVPCVVQDFGSMRERVRHQRTGFICKDDNEFEQQCIQILTDDSIWLRFRTNLTESTEHLGWDEIAKSFLALSD